MAAKPAADESEGYRLREEYERAKERSIWAVTELHRQAQTVAREDFNKLAKYVGETHSEALEVLRALKEFESKLLAP